MRKFIEIKIANPNSFRINFVMTRHCPYECSYCPPSLHTGKHTALNLSDIETFLSRFKNRDAVIHLTGGECTTHPQFKDVIKAARNVGLKVLVDSNCVRTLRFYDEVKDLVDNWCITLHPSQHTLDLEKLKLLSQHSFLVVYVAMDPAHWSKALDWFEQVSQLVDLKVTPIRIMNNYAGAEYVADYSTEQLEVLSKLESKWLFTHERETALRKTHMWLADTEATLLFDDNTSSTLDAFELIRNKQNKFFGWSCQAGNESICIYEDGAATWANCGIKHYSSYLDLYPEDLSAPVKCTFIECCCGTDIRASKSKTLNR